MLVHKALTMLDDDYEHTLCEWVKARRGKASYDGRWSNCPSLVAEGRLQGLA